MKRNTFSPNLHVLVATLVLTVVAAGCPEPPGNVAPDVTGMTQSEAESELEQAGLEVGQENEEHSHDVPAGNLISQDPEAGAPVEEGDSIDLVVSLGPPQTDVPGVTEMAQSEAESAIQDAGLTVGNVAQEESAAVPEGRVISQTPEEGATVDEGSSVDLVISLGPPQTEVPDVTGIGKSEAETEPANAGLSLGTVDEEHSETVPAGVIISQSPSAGSTVDEGSSVSVVVSIGPPPQEVEVPDLGGMSQADAEAELADAGLSVGTVAEEESESFDEGHVIRHDPSAGEMVPEDSPVDLVISSGTDAIAISTIEELQKIGNETGYPITGNYVLANDIDASDTTTWDDGEGFDPIGSDYRRFTGYFDGQGYAISGLVINRPDEDYVGLFGYLGEDGVIKDVRVSGGTIRGADYVGSIAGYSDQALIEDSSSTCTVNGQNYVGGLVGWSSGVITASFSDEAVNANSGVGGIVGTNEGEVRGCLAGDAVTGSGHVVGGVAGRNTGTIKDCLAEGNVKAEGSSTGGLLGFNEGGTISESGAVGEVEGQDDSVGGLIGATQGGVVSKAWATGHVVGVRQWRVDMGGLIGTAINATISECFAEGAVEGRARVGGLVGYIAGDTTIARSYARGDVTVTGGSRGGGLVGATDGGAVSRSYSSGAVEGDGRGGLVGPPRQWRDPASVSRSFWDIEASGLTESYGGEGRITSEMKSRDTYTGEGWDFTDVWNINEGEDYPYLRWAFDED